MTRQLWDHQTDALDALRQSVRQGVRRIVMQAPTGSGKTVVAATIVDGAQRKGNRMAFVVSHLSLIDQVIEEFYAEGIRDIGVIQADHHMTDWSKPVQVCSIQTLQSRGQYPEAQVVLFDECHVLFEYHKKWLQDPAWQDVPFIGLSATPWTRGLGKYFSSLLVAATTQELIDKGLLSKFRVFATGHPNLQGVKIVAGDYNESQLSERMQEGGLTADIIRTWKERWGKDKTLVFAVDIAHAKALQARFLEAGISCGFQEAGTPASERKEIKQKFHSGELRVVTNVGTLTTGVDWNVHCLVLARPTRSEMLFVQIVGRALRTAEGKDYAMILDHSDTTSRLGFVTQIHHEHLDDGKPKKKADDLSTKRLPKPCPQCDCMLPRRMGKCVNCGFEMKLNVSGLIERDGELIEITEGMRLQKRGASKDRTMAEKATFLSGLKYVCLEKGYKPGWAANQYRTKFKVWPHNVIEGVAAAPPTMEVKMWLKSRAIAYAKGMQRRQAAGGSY